MAALSEGRFYPAQSEGQKRRCAVALSRIAQMHADEIRNHDWSDAPYRTDRAGHNRASDTNPTLQLDSDQTARVRTNVMWVTAQVLAYNDPNFDVIEFADACGVERGSGWIKAGLRRSTRGGYAAPGAWD